MWADLSFPWRICVEMAWEAYCAGTTPIGAVIINPAGSVVSTGRNRIYGPRDANLEYLSGMELAHAEMNALLSLDKRLANPRECSLYTTTEPCPMCAGALVMANIRRVHFAARDPWAGSTNLFTANTYLSGKHIAVQGPAEPIFEAALFALQAEFYLREEALRGGTSNPLTKLGPVLESMQAVHPEGVSLGQQLYHSGELQRMCAGGYPAREVLDNLETMVIRSFVTSP